MRRLTTYYQISLLFLFIFIIKIGIALSPIIKEQVCAKAVNAVIMQLEIHPSDQTEIKDASSLPAFSFLPLYSHAPLSPSQDYCQQYYTINHRKHHSAFYPLIPTPPPDQVIRIS